MRSQNLSSELLKFFVQLRTVFLPPNRFDNQMERFFLDEYSEKFISQRWISIVIGLCFCLAYLGFDVFSIKYDAYYE